MELIKSEFIQLKKEELEYIDNIFKISNNRILSEYEKIEIYRTLKSYEARLNELLKKIRNKIIETKNISHRNFKDIIIEFNVSKDFLLSLESYYKKRIFEDLGIDIETLKYVLILYDLIYGIQNYTAINQDIVLHNQKLIEKPIYIFNGYYDSSEECVGPAFGYPDGYIYGVYEDIWSNYNNKELILKKEMNAFEQGKTIIHSKAYVRSSEVRELFYQELLNIENNTINDCVKETRKKVEELSYVRSPEYKEKVLLDKINELYSKVKGEFIKDEVLYSGSFLSILKETYRLPNDNIVEKEKVIKNGGKNSVIVIAITQEKEYIITFQNRIKDKIIAEFPSGYIENNEDTIEAAKRELQEETGYITDDLFIIDEAFTSSGIDNSVTYIVIANNCIKTDEIKNDGTELVSYGLFQEKELNYLISNNIMNGAMNKLAYYNLINNVDDCNVNYVNSNKKIYKRMKQKNKLEL